MSELHDGAALEELVRRIDEVIQNRRSQSVAPTLDETALAARLAAYEFAQGRPLADVSADLLDLLARFAVRSDHPRYFGLFNPPALTAGIAGDLVTAAINPQLAVWSHAPAAAEIEKKLVQLFGSFAWPGHVAAGTFTSGGSEANLTALLCALSARYPDWKQNGLPRDGRRPAIYVSSESHLAWIKIARLCGLGSDSVRLVPAEDGLRLTGESLVRALESGGGDPVLVVATAGTTAHGAIDDIAGIAAVGRKYGSHIHVDAAWAGGALVDPGHRALFAGIEQADSVTIDPHKWLCVPMGAGLYLAKSWRGLADAFGVATGYMPSASTERHDAYIHSVQWSRRFIGGKLFVALATLGLDGYRAMITRQFAAGDRLRARLLDEGWKILNDTTLPLVCFAMNGATDEATRAVELAVAASGEAWLSSVRLRGRLVLRACITSFETTDADIDVLVSALGRAR